MTSKKKKFTGTAKFENHYITSKMEIDAVNSGVIPVGTGSCLKKIEDCLLPSRLSSGEQGAEMRSGTGSAFVLVEEETPSSSSAT